jgi:type IV pilus assembly protein PilQ
MKRSLVLAAVGLLVAPPWAFAGPGEVTAVSVVPGPGQANVVIDVRGSVSVQDFTLTGPARLVIDVTGATLMETGTVYDGVNRGGITNIRTAQFLPDVVRIVLDLESLRDYQIERSDDAIRVSFGADRTFAAWSSLEPRALAASASGGVDASQYELAPPPTVVQGSQQPRITVTYDSASIADVMAGFAAFSGRSVIIGKEVAGYVTAEIRNQPWDVAFRSILESQGLSAVEESSGIIRVDSRAVLAARDSIEPLRTKLIRVDYARASALIPAVEAVLTARGKVVADTGTNSLIITDVESRIDDDSVFVSRLDIRTPQVSIHAKLIFVDRTDIENLGVRYDLGTSSQFFNRLIQRTDPSSVTLVDLDGDGTNETPVFTTYPQETNIIDLGGNSLSGIGNAEAIIPSPALQLVFSTAMGGFSLSTFVEALQQIELADLQAEPLITTSDNTEAEILVGEKTPIRQIDVSSQSGAGAGAPRATTEIVPTGINLRVTPHVTSGRQILMRIHAENSSIRAAPADVGFTFQTQEADNQILVNDGETAVIGGLTVTEVTVAKTGIPFLVDLPIIGKIFGFTSRREQRRDLLILVTPHIIDDASDITGGN